MTLNYTLNELPDILPKFWTIAQKYKVWALHGEMGTGKTTLISALGNLLHFDDDVSSPTFSLINQYNFNNNGLNYRFYHCDLYRLNDEEDAFNAGVEDVINAPNSFVAIEWAERIPHLMPKDALHISINQLPDGSRSIEF